MDKAGAEVGAKTRRQRISQLGRRTRLSDDSDSESMLSDQSDLFCTQRSETKDKLYPAVAVKKLLQETKNKEDELRVIFSRYTGCLKFSLV